MELDGEMSMDTKLIGKFITQQVAVAMAEKKKQYEKKIKKLEKGGRDGVSRESTTKNGTRGGECASKKKKTSQTQPNTKSRPPQKSTSLSAQGRKSIIRSPSRGRSQQAGASNSGTPEKGKRKYQRAPKAHQRQPCRPRKPKSPNHAVGPIKGEGKLQIPSR